MCIASADFSTLPNHKRMMIAVSFTELHGSACWYYSQLVHPFDLVRSSCRTEDASSEADEAPCLF
jgi:hypothetical protein